jgi:DNA polymerase III epsilon subunit-like protein
MNKTIWCDVETTGLSHKTNQIIELAMLYEDGNENNKSVFHKFCKPDVKPDTWDKPIIKSGNNKMVTISEYTGITWEYLEKNGISERELYEQAKAFLDKRIAARNPDDKAIFAAYNAGFDNRFMRALWDKHGDKYFGSYFESANLDILATVALARKNGVLPKLVNNQQDTVAKHFGIKFKSHSAIEDIKAGRQVQMILERKLKMVK